MDSMYMGMNCKSSHRNIQAIIAILHGYISRQEKARNPHKH
jgi:hypothetical protein